MTKIIEFKNKKGEILRGLLDEAKSSRGAVFVHGFERTTVESKFKSLNDRLKGSANLLRFDFSGCGLSDGTFFDFSVKKAVEELNEAVDVLIAETKVKEVYLIGHSVAGCIIAEYLKKYDTKIDKVILLAPALNQRELLRYWFARGQNKKESVTWQNYKKYLNEKDFLKDIKTKQKMLKDHFISSQYFLENYEKDYNDELSNSEHDIYVIHGDSDDKVPPESNKLRPNIIVKKGDHDLQRPDMISQWLDKTTNYLLR